MIEQNVADTKDWKGTTRLEAKEEDCKLPIHLGKEDKKEDNSHKMWDFL